MSAIIEFFEGILNFLEMFVKFFTQGFKIIDTFINLPADSAAALDRVSDYFPPYIWVPVMSIVGICVLLRIWSVITSGGN